MLEKTKFAERESPPPPPPPLLITVSCSKKKFKNLGSRLFLQRRHCEREARGEYWIEPTASGDPFTVFCDMVTDRGKIDNTIHTA